MQIEEAILGNAYIKKLLQENKTFIAGKLGNTEKKIMKLKEHGQSYDPMRNEGSFNAGIYPSTDEIFDFFCDVYVNAIKNVDVFGSSLGWDDFETIKLNDGKGMAVFTK